MARLSLAKLERHLYGAADILRSAGMDAAVYKDYIFGLLFLKRCSDVFTAEREGIVHQKVKEGLAREAVERKYGENPDYYDGFFVPEHSRWSYLQERLNDAKITYGSLLDKALAGLSESNESLQHVLDHIMFMKVQGNKRVVSDEACKALVRHFNKFPLRNEDFQFSDLLGSAYEFLINMFAESAGKKGGDFYTPRDVIRLMVRLLAPRPGMTVYDPTCGSGGMLIITREHVEHSGGDPTNLRLCGQVNDASAWSICKINMLLHDIQGADIQLQDTLLHPMHREGGELERFDRVIANPPFSQNYTKTDMEFPERFRWGWCPTSGKKGDLMFAQHMLAVCKPRGMVATVMPHGVLFRGGEEKEIRKKFLQQDLIEAVIGLPQNLFYGASIPACIIVMRPNLTGKDTNPNKPESHRGRVLFINADAEYLEGRAQNYLRPEHIEKIASTYERYAEVPGYSRVVSLEEISSEANDFNLNIRRYVDNSPPPEAHDVRAHLMGGVPVSEIEVQQSLYTALNFAPSAILTASSGDARYQEFGAAVTERAAIAGLVEDAPGVQARRQETRDALAAWWAKHSVSLAAMPKRRNLNAVRTECLNSFNEAMLPLGVLDSFTLSGIVAAWWTDTLPDFKTLTENGFKGVVEGWVDAIADAVQDDDNAGPSFDPFAHKLVKRVMGVYLQQIDRTKADIARLKGEKESFEQSNAPDDLDEDDLSTWNYARELECQLKELKAENRDAVKELARLEKLVLKGDASVSKAVGKARAALKSYFEEVATLEKALVPYDKIKTDLAAIRAIYRELIERFVVELRLECDSLTEPERQALVLDLLATDLQAGLDAAFLAKRQRLVKFLENLWDKYRVPLEALKREREAVSAKLDGLLLKLGYTRERPS